MRLSYQLLLALCLFVPMMWVLTPQQSLDTVKQNLADAAITTKITAQFIQSKNLNPFKIFASSQNGTTTLKGTVKDKQAYVEALRLVKATKGVKIVHVKDLYIKQVNTAFTDTYITAKVETAVLKAKVFDDEKIPLAGINAKTINGVVTISGTLKRQQSVDAIIKRVNHIKGVRHVVSNLEINDKAKI